MSCSAGATAGPARLTTDEESSGIVDTEVFLGPGTFLLNAQAHTAKKLVCGTGPGMVQEFVKNGPALDRRRSRTGARVDGQRSDVPTRNTGSNVK